MGPGLLLVTAYSWPRWWLDDSRVGAIMLTMIEESIDRLRRYPGHIFLPASLLSFQIALVIQTISLPASVFPIPIALVIIGRFSQINLITILLGLHPSGCLQGLIRSLLGVYPPVQRQRIGCGAVHYWCWTVPHRLARIGGNTPIQHQNQSQRHHYKVLKHGISPLFLWAQLPTSIPIVSTFYYTPIPHSCQ